MSEAYQAIHICLAISSITKKINVRYDSDSFTIDIDNHSSKCMLNDIKHFVTPPTFTSNNYLMGAGGNLTAKEWEL